MQLLKLIAIAAAMSSVLAGCAVLGGSRPLDTYTLAAPIPQATSPRASRVQLLVGEPTALRSLDGENLVIKPTPSSIQFLSGAQWADRLPRLVQARLAEALQESGRFGGVGRPGEGLAIDYQLVIDLRAFELRLDGSSRAHVELQVRILNDRDGVVRATRVFSASVAAPASGNDAIAASIDAAFARVAGEIVVWVSGII